MVFVFGVRAGSKFHVNLWCDKFFHRFDTCQLKKEGNSQSAVLF